MAGLGAGQRVLDVACGTGLVTFRAAMLAAPGGDVVGTDISDEMIGAARGMARAGAVDQLQLRAHGRRDLAFADGSFDAALCALGLMYAPNPEKAVAEMHRV